MSAYAKGLFPPIDSDTGTRKEQEEKKQLSSDGDVQQPNVPLHCINNYDDVNDDISYSSSRNDNSNIGCLLLNSAAIAVKEAKIDPVRWIQYVTGPNPQHYAHQIGKTLRRRVSNSISGRGGGSTQLSPVSVDNINTTATSGGSNSNKSKNNSPQNEAIEFELSIIFNGRKYTAKRTMQCIMQLRDDLIREMKHRRRWLTRGKGGGPLSYSPSSRPQRYGSSTVGNHYDGSKIINTTDSYCNSPLSSNTSYNHEKYTAPKTTSVDADENDYGVQIPEIPPLSVDEERSFVGRGFTMLHAVVTSYVPVMERWLKNVMAIVPQDSECLMNFLWEPTVEISTASCKSVLDSINNSSSNNINSRNFVSGKKFKSSTSLATLGSIKEIDHDTEDESEDDCSW